MRKCWDESRSCGCHSEILEAAEEKISGDTAIVLISNQKEHHLVQVGKIWKVDDSGDKAAESNVESVAYRMDAVARAGNNEMAPAVQDGRFQTSAETKAALQRDSGPH
jgi:hypothetical protein